MMLRSAPHAEIRGGSVGDTCDFLLVSIAKTPRIPFEFRRCGNSRLRIDPG